MLLRTKHLTILLLAAICLMAQSCEKDQPECKGNCVSIRISGRVYDKTTGVGFKDVPIKVKWIENRYCIGCTSYKVEEGNSRSDGSFDFTNTIDSSFFKNYYLSVSTLRDTNHLSLPGSGGISTLEQRFNMLDLNALQQIKFEYFPKTILRVRLRRTQNDVFSYFNVGSTFISNFSTGYYTVAGQQNAKDTTLVINTAANVYTKVVYEKSLNGIQTSSKTDSIICTQNGANTLDINY